MKEVDLEPQLERLRQELDLRIVHSQYWLQNEFVTLEQMLPASLVGELVTEARQVESALHRSRIPGYKKGAVSDTTRSGDGRR